MHRPNTRVAIAFVLALGNTGCGGVDQQKFDALYRVAKEVEVETDHSSAVNPTESQKLLKRFQTQIALLDGRTSGADEAAALAAYSTAADAYKSFLGIRSLDLDGLAVDGRLRLLEGWVPVGEKFNFAVNKLPRRPGDDYQWYSVDVGDAVEALLAAVKKNLTDANRIVNG